MITVACIKCHLALRTTGEFSEVDFLVGKRSEWYPNRYPCPRSGCDGKMAFADMIDSEVYDMLEVHDLTPQECFQAFNGLGLPTERSCTPDDLLSVLVGKKVSELDVCQVNNDRRSIVYSLVVEDGTRIYFGSSPQGAIVYRIAPPRSVVKEIFGE